MNLYLPICFEQLPSDETREEAPDIVGNEHVLFVDDEAAVLHLGTAILERVGYRVTTATDGIDAKQKLKAGWKQFDIVVTDVTMPNMTGIELAKFVREIHPEFPVILSTGYSGAVSDQLIKELTIDHLLMKPYRPTVLEDVVRKALDSRALV